MRSGVLQLVVDDRVLAEYANVLTRPYFRKYITDSEQRDMLDYLRRSSAYTTSRVSIRDLPDPADVPFLELALSENVPLVTGNGKHFPAARCRGATILAPSEFIARRGR